MLFQSLNLEFEIQVSKVSEESISGEKPLDYLRRVTLSKAESVAKTLPSDSKTFVSSDTIVVSEGNILQKPINEKEAIRMLTELSGKEHKVYSGLCILNKHDSIWDYDETKIICKNWNLSSILDYVKRAQPFDKAGSYGIQDENSPVHQFIGSYTNVMGFPIRKFFLYRRFWERYL